MTVKINEDLCTGCGLCVSACKESAIALIGGKAKLVREDYCDGLGMCLPVCPTGAISLGEPPLRTEDTAHLRHWPLQIQLISPNAPCFEGAHLLIAADCTAFAYAHFHSEYMQGKVTLIGCPKLDETDYSEKLADILRANDIKSVTAARMEVPCCAAVVTAAGQALKDSGKQLPFHTVTFSIGGKVLPD